MLYKHLRTMFSQCQICLEEIDGHDKIPVAMPCGHIYCMDCATFWFASENDGHKCSCGRVFSSDDIIRLWVNTEGAGPSSSSQDATRACDRQSGQRELEVLAACNAAVAELEEGRQDAALAAALSRCVS